MNKYSEINKELLEKYVENTCSEEERSSVEKWLDEPSFGVLEAPPSFEEDKEKIREEIWRSLPAPAAKRRTLIRLSSVLKYAACLIGIVLISVFYRENVKHELWPEHDGASQLSEVIHIDKPTFITAKTDSEILFVLTVDKSRKVSRQISCEAGNTYLAIKINFRSKDELLIVNKKDIQSLPPSIEGYIISQLNTI